MKPGNRSEYDMVPIPAAQAPEDEASMHPSLAQQASFLLIFIRRYKCNETLFHL